MKAREFLATRSVFTHDEFASVLRADEPRSVKTREALIDYYTRNGKILRVRRGLYLVVPPGATPETCPVDPFLLAGKMADDAVLAYHTALEYHGRAYSVREEFTYATARSPRPMRFRSMRFQPVPFPKPLRAKGQELFGVRTEERAGIPLRVATMERTLVDVLDRPSLGGGWEEIWRSLEAVEFFDLDQVVAYTLLLENATTAAKVGFFLEQHREPLMVHEGHLGALRARRPRSPHYLSRDRGKTSRFVASWNLVVPVEVMERSWGEVT